MSLTCVLIIVLLIAYSCSFIAYTGVCLRDISGSVPDHHNKSNVTTKRVPGMFGFPSAYELCSCYTAVY